MKWRQVPRTPYVFLLIIKFIALNVVGLRVRRERRMARCKIGKYEITLDEKGCLRTFVGDALVRNRSWDNATAEHYRDECEKIMEVEGINGSSVFDNEPCFRCRHFSPRTSRATSKNYLSPCDHRTNYCRTYNRLCASYEEIALGWMSAVRWRNAVHTLEETVNE